MVAAALRCVPLPTSYGLRGWFTALAVWTVSAAAIAPAAGMDLSMSLQIHGALFCYLTVFWGLVYTDSSTDTGNCPDILVCMAVPYAGMIPAVQIAERMVGAPENLTISLKLVSLTLMLLTLGAYYAVGWGLARIINR